MAATAQALAALEKGNRRRLARAAFRRDLADLSYMEGKALVADLLQTEPPDHLRTMTAFELLCSIYRVGPLLAARWCAFAGVAESAQLAGLTERQVKALREELA